MVLLLTFGPQLMPDPGGYQPYMITIPKDGDLHQATEIIRPLRIGMVMQNVPTIRHVLMDAACLGPKSRWTDSSAPLSDERIDEIAQELGLGRWNFYGAVYGPKAVRDASLNVIKEAFSAIPGSKLYFPEDVKDPKAVLHMRALSMKGVPSLDELAWIDWLPNGSHLFFSPISPTTGISSSLAYVSHELHLTHAGNDATKQANMVRRACEAAGFDYFSTFLIGLREMRKLPSWCTARLVLTCSVLQTTLCAWCTTVTIQILKDEPTSSSKNLSKRAAKKAMASIEHT
jgi:hypothetical protein